MNEHELNEDDEVQVGQDFGQAFIRHGNIPRRMVVCQPPSGTVASS